MERFGFVLVALATLVHLSSPAQADKFLHVIKSDLRSAIDGTDSVPLDISIEGLCLDGTAFYHVTNNGTTWPKRAKLAIYLAGSKKPVLKRILKLRKGSKVTFKINFENQPYRALDIRFMAPWMASQRFQHTFKHTPAP